METPDMAFQIAVFYKVAAVKALSLQLVYRLFIRMHPEIVFLKAFGQKLPITYVALHLSVFYLV
jgi:hypothetical protein